MGRHPKEQHNPEPTPPVNPASIKPDREAALLGSYVVFRKDVKTSKGTIPSGSTGILVSDAKGLCLQGEVAVRLQNFPYKDYIAVKRELVEILRTVRVKRSPR